MAVDLSEYWARLTDTVHPDDVSLLAKADHAFNLDYPPPAFIGDIRQAPVVILDNNGGYDQEMTPGEFPDEAAATEFRARLATPAPLDPSDRSASPYYLARNFAGWLRNGTAALVNGVAYRSVSGADKAVARLSRSLPSAHMHRRWLRETLLPQLDAGQRFVVIHRWTR